MNKLKYIRIQNEDGSYGEKIPFYVDSSTVEVSGQSLTTKINEINNSLANKVIKEQGKGLSSNDYTNEEKQKLSGIEAGATNTIIDSTLNIEGAAADALAVKERISTEKNALQQAINLQANHFDAEIAQLQSLVGSPLTASTISEMTNTDKIYVYTGSESGYTNGNWYYWNGSAWTSGGVYNAVAFETDKTLSVENMPADAKVVGGKISELKEDLSDTTQNIWQWGDQEVTGVKTVTHNANIPAGTYTLSALVTKNESGNVRMIFYKDLLSEENLLANPYIVANSRNSTTFTLAEDCDIVRVFSAANASGTIPAVWSDIQIEAGSNATAFTPHITATDFVARNEIEKVNVNLETVEDNVNDIGDELADVKEDLEQEFVNASVTLTWTQGYIKNTNGTFGSDSNRCYSSAFSTKGKRAKIYVDSDFTVEKIAEYSGSTLVNMYTGLNITGTYALNTDGDYTYRMQVRRYVESALVPSDISATDVTVNYMITDETLTQPGKSADAKVTGDKFVDVSDTITYSDDMLDHYSGFKPIYFEKGYYYTTPDVGSASSRTSSSNYIGAKCQVSQGEVVTFYIANNNSESSPAIACALLDAQDVVVSKHRMLNGGTIIIPSGVASIVINNRLSLLASGYYAYVSNSQTRNIWVYGDQSFTASKTISVNIPAGTYVFSAYIVSENNNADALGYTARIEWYNGETQELMKAINRNCRGSVRVTFEHAIDSMKIFASNTRSNSSGASSVWSNIQLEKGDFQTPYIPPNWVGTVPPIVKSDEIAIMENISISGSATNTYHFIRGYKDQRNVVIDVEAKYTGTPATDYTMPQTRIYYSTSDKGTGPYAIGAYGEYRKQSFRLPPFPDFQSGDYINNLSIQIIVPKGLTLVIKKLTAHYDNEMTRPFNAGIKWDTHGAFLFYPSHTYPAANAAQACGATRFITIPKRTSDGVWFAYHDDTFDLATTTLRNADGSAIESSEYNGLPFSQIPWSYLKDLTVSVSGSYGAFDGVKLMTIVDFFMLCNRTGMKPMFSMHPRPITGEVQSLYDLCKLYGMIDKLTIKPASTNTFGDVYAIFGDEVESYGLITKRSNATDTDVEALITAFDNSEVDKTKVRCFVELWVDLATPTQVQMILDAGYYASLATISHTDPSGVTSSAISGADFAYWSALGVTEFCDNVNSSMGLNW